MKTTLKLSQPGNKGKTLRQKMKNKRQKPCVGWRNPTAANHCGGKGQTRFMGEYATVCPQCGAPQVGG